MDVRSPDPDRCHAEVAIKGEYRYVGGRRQFARHYTYRQCSRTPRPGTAHCWQHDPERPVTPHRRRG